MEEQSKFYIEKDGKNIEATILTNFEIYSDHYCIYTIPSENNKENSIYCAKIIGSNLIKIETEQEKNITNKVVQKLLGNLKG